VCCCFTDSVRNDLEYLTNVDNEGAWDNGNVDPATIVAQHLQSAHVWRCLQKKGPPPRGVFVRTHPLDKTSVARVRNRRVSHQFQSVLIGEEAE